MSAGWLTKTGPAGAAPSREARRSAGSEVLGMGSWRGKGNSLGSWIPGAGGRVCSSGANIGRPAKERRFRRAQSWPTAAVAAPLLVPAQLLLQRPARSAHLPCRRTSRGLQLKASADGDHRAAPHKTWGAKAGPAADVPPCTAIAAAAVGPAKASAAAAIIGSRVCS